MNTISYLIFKGIDPISAWDKKNICGVAQRIRRVMKSFRFRWRIVDTLLCLWWNSISMQSTEFLCTTWWYVGMVDDERVGSFFVLGVIFTSPSVSLAVATATPPLFLTCRWLLRWGLVVILLFNPMLGSLLVLSSLSSSSESANPLDFGSIDGKG